MRGQSVLLVGLAFLLTVACSSKREQGQVLGAGVSLQQVLPVAQVLAKPDQFVNQKVRVKGKITACCQHKGCWIALEADGKQLIVRFKDEAFTVPTNSTGRIADVEGVLLPPGTQVPMAESQEEMENCPEGDHQSMAPENKEQPETYTMIATGLVLL